MPVRRLPLPDHGFARCLILIVFNDIHPALSCYSQSGQYTQSRSSNMPSELKSETSRINGAKSHGPKTPEGKETSSRNALKNGWTETKTFILQCESYDEYRAFLAEHNTIHQPATAPEK